MVCCPMYKSYFNYYIRKKLDLTRFVGSGGIPSSHSALVVSMSTSIGMQEGFRSVVFALSVALL